jgi:hypothetical protein
VTAVKRRRLNPLGLPPKASNPVAAENMALHQGRMTGYRATVVVHCLDGLGTQGNVTVQTFYPHAGAGDEWLLAALRILADEARARGLIGDRAMLEDRRQA